MSRTNGAASRFFQVSAFALAAGLAGHAAAEEVADASDVVELGEIVVTAKGRSERIEDVSLSIAAIGMGDLKNNQVRDMRDLASMVPGLVLEASRGRASASTLAIRGLAPNTINKQLQSVSVFLDGVFLGGSASMFDFPDIEAVEVLRGPQATQFGRQTYAGAINYRLAERTPDEISVHLDSFISQNSGAKDLNREMLVKVDVPIVADKLWVSASGRWKQMGALATRANATRKISIGEEKTKAGSASILFKPIDNFKLKLFGIYQEQRDSTPAFTTMQVEEWLAAGTELTTISGVYWPTGTLGKVSPDMAGCESNVGRPEMCGIERNQFFVSGNADWTFGEGYTLSVRGGYQEEDSWSNQDLYYRQGGDDPFFGDRPYSRRVSATSTSPLKAATPFFSATSDKHSVVSSEIRLVSPGDRQLRWKVGGYYFYESLTTFAQINERPTNPDGRSRGDENVRNYAVFGDVSYDFSDRFTVQLEARYDVETNIFDECLTCSTAVTGGYKDYVQKEKNRNFLPRATLTFRPTEGSQIYALYSEGTKPGRWNQTIRTNFQYVDPEQNQNYEVGAKYRSADNRIFLSGAAFYMDIKDQQFSAVSTASGVPITLFQNIGSSEVKGFELEGSFRPAPSWNFRAGVAYAKQEYTTDVGPDDANLVLLFNGSTFEGKTSIGLPQWTGSAGVDYDTEVGKDIFVRVGTNVSYTGKRYADAANLAQLAGLWRWNMNAGVDYKNLGLQLFVRDLLDNNKAVTAATSATNSCLYMAKPAGGTYSLSPEQRCLAVGIDRGREIGVSVSLKF